MIGPGCNTPFSDSKVPDFGKAIKHINMHGLDSLPLQQQMVFGELFTLRNIGRAWDKQIKTGLDSLSANERALVAGITEETIDDFRLDDQTIVELDKIDPEIQSKIDSDVLNQELSQASGLLRQTREGIDQIVTDKLGDTSVVEQLKNNSESPLWENLDANDSEKLKQLFEVEQSLSNSIGKIESSAATVMGESAPSKPVAPDSETIAMSRAFVDQVQQLPGAGKNHIEAHKLSLEQRLADVRTQIKLKELGTDSLIARKGEYTPHIEAIKQSLENDPTVLPPGSMEVDRQLKAINNEIAYVDSLPPIEKLLEIEENLVREQYLLRSTEEGFNPELKIAGIPLPNMYKFLTWLDELGSEGFPEARALTEEEAQRIAAQNRQELWESLPKPFRNAINRTLGMVKDTGHRVTQSGQKDVLNEAISEQTNRQAITAEAVEVKSGFDSKDLEDEIRNKMPSTISNLKAQYSELAGEDPVRAYQAWSKVFTDKIDPVMHDQELRSLAHDFLQRDGISDQTVAEALNPILSSLNRQGTAEFLGARIQLAYSMQKSGRIADKFLNLGPGASDELRADTSKLLITQLAQTLGLQRAYRQTVRGIGRTLRAAGLNIDAESIFDPGKGQIAAAWTDMVKKEMNERPVKMLGHAVSQKMDNAITQLEKGLPVNWKDKALQEELSVLAMLAKDMEAEPVTGVLADQLKKGASLGVNGLLTARTANILSSWGTFWMNTVNGVMRVATLPAYPVFGAALTPQELPKALKRSAMTYAQIGKQLSGAIKLGAISFQEGIGLYDPMGQRVEGMTSAGIVDDFVEVRPELGWDINRITSPEFRENHPHWSLGINFLWRALTFPLRMLSASDTMLKSVQGNAEHWVRLYERSYDELVRSKATGDIGKTAALRADKLLKADLMDVIIHPDDPRRRKVIPEAAMSNEQAINTGRQVTFTDDFLVDPEKRSMRRGQELAKQKGVEEADMPYETSEYMRQNEGYRIPKTVTDLTHAIWIWPKLLADARQSKIGPLVTVVATFLKTPTNLIKSAMRHGPTAPLVDSWWRDLTSEDMVTRQRARGEVVLGSMAIAGTIYMMNHNTNIEITGAGPLEYNTRKMWREAQGYAPYSFRTRKNADSEWSEWTSYRSFEPLASIVATIADYRMMNHSMTEEERDRLGGLIVLKTLGSAANSTLGKTWFTGISELIDMLQRTQNKDTKIPGRRHPFFRWIQRNAASFAPSSSRVRISKRQKDPTVRTVPSGTFGSEMLGELSKVARVPGWNPELPPVLDPLTGEPIVLQGINGAEWAEGMWFEGLVNAGPHTAFQVPQYPKDPVKKAIADAGVGLGPYSGNSVKKRYTRKGRIKDNHMTHEEYSAWLTFRTKGLVEIDGRAWTLYDRLAYVINSDEYNALTDYGGVKREIQRNYRAERLVEEIKRFDEMADKYFELSPAAERINENLARFVPLDKIDQYNEEFGRLPDAKIIEQATDKAAQQITGN